MSPPKHVVVLGSTGSIGRQALEVLPAIPRARVVGLAAGMLDGYGYESLKGPLMARGAREVARLYGETDLVKTQTEWEKAMLQSQTMEERMSLFLDGIEQRRYAALGRRKRLGRKKLTQAVEFLGPFAAIEPAFAFPFAP